MILLNNVHKADTVWGERVNIVQQVIDFSCERSLVLISHLLPSLATDFLNILFELTSCKICRFASIFLVEIYLFHYSDGLIKKIPFASL